MRTTPKSSVRRPVRCSTSRWSSHPSRRSAPPDFVSPERAVTSFRVATVVEHTAADLTGRLAIVMGNEAAGLPDEWDDEVGPIDVWLTIRHRGRSESLNVAMAATVLAFEAARQRSGEA